MEIRRRPQTGKMDHWLYIAVLGISAFGLVMMFSASYYSAQYSASTNHDGFFYLRNQVQYLLIGIVGMYVMSRIQYRYLEKLKVIALVVTILLMIAVVFWGRELNGAKRWLTIGGLPSFQPSELVKAPVRGMSRAGKCWQGKKRPISSLRFSAALSLAVTTKRGRPKALARAAAMWPRFPSARPNTPQGPSPFARASQSR